ncbi:thrombospondin type 3 repeat-containing protein [Patescibacteria group bacterium]|nr:thrombospondin type 3 repeat-containing protein [Patescibacteria group bacterium]
MNIMNTSIHQLKLQKKHGLKLFLFVLFFTTSILSVWIIGKKEPWNIEALAAPSMVYGTPIAINNPTPTVSDEFGNSISISGDKVLIGAKLDDIGATNAGSAYLYDATTGALLQTFNNPTPAEQDGFGYSVSISGDKVLIGAIYDDTVFSDSGAAYLFDATTGALLHTFNNPTPNHSDVFGISVSISGDKVLIGAQGDNTGGNHAGSAYLFDATTGALLQTINNTTAYEIFGHSVSISGDNILIGAPDTYGIIGEGGTAYLFDATTGALLQTFNNPTPAIVDLFGSSVSISGDKVLIGAQGDNTGGNHAGSAYLFDATTGALLQTFNNPTPVADDVFGLSVSISDTTVLIGTPRKSTGAFQDGTVYMYLPLPDTDTDSDGIFDSVDNCPADVNVDQADTDSDGQGNVCDFTPNGDMDGDGVDELADNCPGIANPGQEDADADGIGNVCDPTPNGDPDPDPTDIDQCKNVGWMDYAFSNQGQCVSFVNTGHDSR